MIAGVCAGIAQTLGVDATLVRLVFALLALAGGAGILLYLGLWAWAEGKQVWIAALLAFFAGCALLGALGLSDRSVVGIALIAGGLALAWRQGGSFRPDAPLSYGGIALAAVGAVVLLSGEGTSSKLLAPGAVAGALLLIGGPWVWRLAVERDVERTASDPQRGAFGRGRARPRLGAADAGPHPAPRERASPRRVAGAPAGARAPRLALRRPPARRRDRVAGCVAGGGSGRRRGAPRRAGRAGERRRLPRRRIRERARARGARGDDERGQVRRASRRSTCTSR